MSTSKIKRGSLARARVLSGLCLLAAACSAPDDKPAAHIAIVIGAAGTQSGALRPVYDWSITTVNELGGAGGRRLEATYYELTDARFASKSSQEALADQLLRDPDLVAVAGTFSYALAPKLVAAGVPYITPETSDDDVFRAFHQGGYVWRTLESDSTQLWFMLAEAKGRGEKNMQTQTTVGLLTSTDSYGSTFFDWYGFHAAELGLHALPPVQYDQDEESCAFAVDKLLTEGTPDFVVAVPSGKDPVAQAACMVRTLKERGSAARVLIAATAHTPALISALGADAEGLSGYHAAPDPDSGFSEAFREKTKLSEPPEHAANALDAIALLAYGLEKSEGAGRAALDTAMRRVVDGQGQKLGWQDFTAVLLALKKGESPDISGASGPLSFDQTVYTDPTATFYDRWVVENGAFTTTHHVTTESESSPNVYAQSAVARGLKTLSAGALAAGGGTADLPALAENWALIVATSATWPNYRHQADALAHYHALKQNGFDDRHIVLVTADDVAGAPANSLPGQVLNIQGGPDVHADVVSDYRGQSLTPMQLMTVLAGGSDPDLPEVLHSQAGDNVYLFMVGHGGVEGPYVGMDARSAEQVDDTHFLSPGLLASTISQMKASGKFRRMLIAVDACHSGVLAPELEAQHIPDVLLLTAASEAESSFSANYVGQLQSFAADEFSYRLLGHVQSPGLSLGDLYTRLYEQVTGSHVQVGNAQSFGAASQIMLSEFVRPTPR